MGSFLRSSIVFVVLAAVLAALPAAAGAAPRIVSGTDVDGAGFASRWNFLVALVDPLADNQYDGQFCAGSLIDDQHVLTAAHCVVRPLDEFANVPHRRAPSSIGIVAGQFTLSDSSRGTVHKVAQVFVHPFYSQAASKFDIAVLRLTSPIAGVPTIPLLSHAEAATIGIGAAQVEGAGIAGWGDTDPVASDEGCCFPEIMREATVPIRSDADCTTNEATVQITYDPNSQICAGTLQAGGGLGTDTCQGDSGGPITVQVNGTSRLAGVTSFGVGCAQEAYGIYARMGAVLDWIGSIHGSTTGDARTVYGGINDLHPPSAPKAVQAGYEKVKVSWKAPTSGTAPTSYAVWVRINAPELPGKIDLRLKTTTALSAVVPVPGVRTGLKYEFLVKALDATSNEGTNARVLGAPKIDKVKPTPVRALAASKRGRTITARWGASVDRQTGIEGYEVYAKLGRSWKLIKDLPATKRAAAFRGNSGSTTYRVRAYDGAGNYSAWSTKTI